MKRLTRASLSFLLFATLGQVSTYAGNEGGGGDTSEARVDEIRSDILNWIKKGGSKGLLLPADLGHEMYVRKMVPVLQPQAVTVTFVSSREEEVSNDPELKVEVAGKKKTCRSFISERKQIKNIICNIERFNAVGEADQYKLIHHEYAGLVRVEKNEGAASDYHISNQLSAYLTKTTELRLAIKPVKTVNNCNVYIKVETPAPDAIMTEAELDELNFQKSMNSMLLEALKDHNFTIVKDASKASFIIVGSESGYLNRIRNNQWQWNWVKGGYGKVQILKIATGEIYVSNETSVLGIFADISTVGKMTRKSAYKKTLKKLPACLL